MSNNTALQLSSTETTMNEWQMIREQADVLVKTGFLPKSITSPEQAMAIILTGRELGIGPMAALQGIDVIQGKPSVSPQLMLAMANGTGQVEDIKVETGNDGATVTIKRKGRSPYTTTFGPKEARAMALDGKDNYKKQAPVMYQWRAIGANLRVTFPDVIKGMYVADGSPEDSADFAGGETFTEPPSASETVIEGVVELPPEQTATKTEPPTVAKSALGKSALALKATVKMSDAAFLKLVEEKWSLVANTPAEAADGITKYEQEELIECLKAQLPGGKK